jgi:hypothetical protein
VQFEFDEKIDRSIGKSVKATLRFYNELRKQALIRGEFTNPPSFEAFTTMAKGLMEATKQVDLDKMKNLGVKDVFERAWRQKLLAYSTQKALREAYESLTRRY